MTGPHPAVAAVRLAVRRVLPDAGTVLVACSGGADSLALLAATVFETRRAEVRVVGVVVDHGLQDGSAAHTGRVVEQMAGLGVDETASIRVTVDPGPGGVEAGAREARYVALGRLAAHFAADAVLLAHTLDDQAETVLLGLARGSGGRSLTGMRRGWTDGTHFLRPLLGITRAQTEAACTAEDIGFWVDPHNTDPRFLRARVRHDVLPVLERELGPGVAAALARTGEMLREDMDALDDLADVIADRLDGADLDPATLVSEPAALVTRVVRRLVLAAGATASDLTREHVAAVAALSWPHDKDREIQLPGRLTAYLDDGRLRFRPTEVP